MIKVGVFRNSDGACDFYRTALPTNVCAKNKLITKKEIWKANLLYEVGMRTKDFWSAMSSDIYLTQRITSERLMDRMREFITETGLSAKIVMDWDDDIFNVSPLSNHYVDYGTQEIKIMHNGNLVHEWKDGVNINIKENIEQFEETKQCLAKADMVTVTTDILADVYRPYNKNIKVLPNCVDLKQWNKLPLLREKKDEFRICWAGGHSHWEDLFIIRKALIDICNKYPNVKILMVGYMPNSMENDFAPGQIEFHEWVDTQFHPYRMAALDIDLALIPLKDNDFNRSKSAIKWIEFSAMGVPCISSYVSPYKEMAEIDTDSGMFIEQNNDRNWFEGIEMMINSKKLRDEMADKARAVVKNNFDINTQHKKWADVYEEVANGSSIKPVAV